MRFERHVALCTGQSNQIVEQTQQIDVVALPVCRPGEYLLELADGMLQLVHAVCHHKGSDGCAADRPHLEWQCLRQHLDAAAGYQITAENRDEQESEGA
jgi:hypothetical protein